MKKTALLLSVIVGLSFSVLATANINNAVQQTASPNPSATGISESDLNKFAKAQKEVMQIQQKYQQQLKTNQGQQTAQQVQQNAYKEMSKAVESNGLTTQQYGEIAKKVQQSPQLQQKIKKMQ